MKFNFKNLNEPIFLHDEFFYSLTEGYLNPSKVLKDKAQIEELEKAIKLIKSFQNQTIENKIIEIE